MKFLTGLFGSKKAANPKKAGAASQGSGKPATGGGKGNTANRAAQQAKAAQSKAKDATERAGTAAEGLTQIYRNNAVLEDSTRFLKRLAIGEAGIIGVLLMALLLTGNERPPPKYIGMSSDGRLLPLQPLDEPVLSDTGRRQWVGRAVAECMSFNFRNFRGELQECTDDYFTEDAGSAYLQAISSVVNVIRDRKQLLAADLQGTPTIAQSGVQEGRRVWFYQVPIQLSYRAEGTERTERRVIGVGVHRVPTARYPEGVRITSWREL